MSMDIQQLKQFKILLIGDICSDIYHYGQCDRMSPEAPVPIFRKEKTKIVPGMAGNVKEILKNFNLDVSFCHNSEKIKKIRLVDSQFNHHLLRIDEEPKKINPFIFEIKQENFDAIVVSDYEKGFITLEVAKQISIFAKKNNIPMFVDSKKEDISCYEGCFIKINAKEENKVKKIPQTCELIVTKGKNGASWNGTLYPAIETEVFDVCGAGDAFLCGLVYGYLVYKNLEQAIWFANRCGSIAVSHIGTYALTLEDINDNIC